MISYVRKERRRIFFTIRHEAASAFVLHNENRNPYRPGSPQFILYETEYLDIEANNQPQQTGDPLP